MITLPDLPAPNGVEASLIDYGVNLRAALGGETVRVDRPGSRFLVAVSYPLLTPAQSRVFVSRLVRAKSEGLRIPYPLLSETQGSPGAPVVDGAGQAGTTLPLRGLTPGYVFKEGSWLSIVGNSRHYLHNVTGFARADSAGAAAVSLYPALRFPFPDAAVVHVAQPMIEGFVDGSSADWAIRVDQLVQLAFTIEEVA